MSSAAESGVDFVRIVAMFRTIGLVVSERRRDGRTQTLVIGEWERVCSILTTTSNYSGIVEGHSSDAAVNSLILVGSVTASPTTELGSASNGYATVARRSRTISYARTAAAASVQSSFAALMAAGSATFWIICVNRSRARRSASSNRSNSGSASGMPSALGRSLTMQPGRPRMHGAADSDDAKPAQVWLAHSLGRYDPA
jgi:hypothetical protein